MSVKVSVGLNEQAVGVWVDAATPSSAESSEAAIRHARESLTPGWLLSAPPAEPVERELDALDESLPRWAW